MPSDWSRCWFVSRCGAAWLGEGLPTRAVQPLQTHGARCHGRSTQVRACMHALLELRQASICPNLFCFRVVCRACGPTPARPLTCSPPRRRSRSPARAGSRHSPRRDRYRRRSTSRSRSPARRRSRSPDRYQRGPRSPASPPRRRWEERDAGPGRDDRGARPPRPPPTGACHNCGEEGHWARECPNPPKERKHRSGRWGAYDESEDQPRQWGRPGEAPQVRRWWRRPGTVPCAHGPVAVYSMRAWRSAWIPFPPVVCFRRCRGRGCAWTRRSGAASDSPGGAAGQGGEAGVWAVGRPGRRVEHRQVRGEGPAE